MTTEDRAQVFIQLGTFLASYVEQAKQDPAHLPGSSKEERILTRAITVTLQNNPWFILPNVLLVLQSIAASLAEKDVAAFTEHYKGGIERQNRQVQVGIVMAGNIPAVGFHDFFCVILSGNRSIGKLSSEDKDLLPALGRLMVEWNPEMEALISFPEGKLTAFDAVIATGSDNTSRYFNYYFDKYPHIIRKNRSSVAVVNGREDTKELTDLGIDIFSHFGRGCRNVSKLYLPEGYPPESLFPHWTQFRDVSDHSRYRNNYDYFKSIYSITNLKFIDNGQIILLENASFHTPIAVMHFEFFRDIRQVNLDISQHLDSLQCIVSSDPAIDKRIPYGTAQTPSLFDFADRIDTMDFLVQVGSV